MKIVLFLLAAAACWLSYQAGQDSADLVCKQRFEDLRTQNEAEKKSSDQKIADLESARLNEERENEKRIKSLDAKYQSAVRDSNLGRCAISSDIVGLLSETASDPRLPEAVNP